VVNIYIDSAVVYLKNHKVRKARNDRFATLIQKKLFKPVVSKRRIFNIDCPPSFLRRYRV
jgi:hypothetical protein